ncbi:MAG: hypothetical protein LAP87_10930 [Acidobacteriia bacterium]|nr:hypothetical protein [Terriglobia bacterium]
MRNLRILIIDDQVKRYDHIRYIDPVACITAGAGPTDRLTRWTQHLRWYLEDRVPEFDLLLIDVDFSKDGTAPYDSEVFNPYGLLHALPLAARQHGVRWPFAWAIGTGVHKDMRDNYVAVFAYSLLCAMERRVPLSVVAQPSFEYFRTQIDQLKGPDDKDVFVTLMRRYREQVKTAAGNSRIEFDAEELQQQFAAAMRGDSRSMKPLLDSGLTMYYGYHMESIALRSIFADFDGRDDDPGLAAAVRTFLCALKEAAEKVDIGDDVQKALAGLRNDQAHSPDGKRTINAFVSASDPRANLTKLAALVCCWLEEYIRVAGEKVSAGAIVTALGFTGNIQVHEILRKNGIQCPLGHYLYLLADRPSDLPPSVFNCVARYWDQLKKPKGLKLPGCLRQPEE